MVIRLKVPIEMHYTVIPVGTSKVNSSLDICLHIICLSHSVPFWIRSTVVPRMVVRNTPHGH